MWHFAIFIPLYTPFHETHPKIIRKKSGIVDNIVAKRQRDRCTDPTVQISLENYWASHRTEYNETIKIENETKGIPIEKNNIFY